MLAATGEKGDSMRSLTRYALASALVVPPLLYAAACAWLYAHQRKVLYTPVPHRNRAVSTMPLGALDADVRVSVRPVEGSRRAAAE